MFWLEFEEGMERITAKMFAEAAHGGQMYGENPYTQHLTDVVMNVRAEISSRQHLQQQPFTEDVVRVLIDSAWLHDVVEDTDVSLETIRTLFGEQVAEVVDLLTKKKGLSYKKYIDNIKQNEYALLVKIADTRANLAQSYYDNNEKRIAKYAKQLALLEDV